MKKEQTNTELNNINASHYKRPHGVFGSKKGWAWLFAGTLPALLGSPWIMLGIGIFILVLILLFYLALGKILGAVVMAAGVALLFRTKWIIALLVLILGVILFYNPYNLIPGLQIMW